jgi:hypothetical protein
VTRLDAKVHNVRGQPVAAAAAAAVGMRQVENIGTVVIYNGYVMIADLDMSVRIAGWVVGNPNDGPNSGHTVGWHGPVMSWWTRT